MATQTIVVIEDDNIIRKLIKMALSASYQILTASNGNEGLQIIRQTLPDLVICDISLPDIDGFTILETIRKDEATAHTLFIFVTAHTEREDMRQGMELGANDYITKPFTVKEIRGAIEACFKTKNVYESKGRKAVEELRRNIIRSLPHELRTSLMIVEGYLQLIDEEITLDKEQRWMLKAAQKHAKRLHQLAEKYLWYSRSQVLVPQNPNLVLFSPDTIIRTTALKKANEHERSNDLQMALEDVPITFDEESFAKFIEELLDNAFKFSASGTAIQINTKKIGDQYCITVQDHGRGMTPDQIANIGAFIQFERTTYEQQGTGLGLITAQSLVNQFGGSFSLHSIYGETTIVTVELPCKIIKNNSQVAVQESNPS